MGDLSLLKLDELVLDGNEVFAFDGSRVAWDHIHGGNSLQRAGNFTVRATGPLQVDGVLRLEAANIYARLRESDLARLVLVNDQNAALSVGTGQSLLLLFVEQFDLEFLIGLPVGVVMDFDLDDALCLTSMHRHELILTLVIRVSLGSAILRA